MQNSHMFFLVLVVFISVGVIGCQSNPTEIGKILADPRKFVDREVVVKGEVTRAFSFGPYGAYEVTDRTSLIEQTLTVLTPNGTLRPGHPGPPHQHRWEVNDPEIGPRSGFKRGKAESLGGNMRGITITDSTPDGRFLTFDLIDILQQLGSTALDSEWEISEVECTGAMADKLHWSSDTQTRVQGKMLVELAGYIRQIINGEFIGYKKNETLPWIIIYAVDSTAYDIQTNDDQILSRLKQSFKNVADLPSE